MFSPLSALLTGGAPLSIFDLKSTDCHFQVKKVDITSPPKKLPKIDEPLVSKEVY